MKGLILVSRYFRDGNKWRKESEELNILNIDVAYWKGSGFGSYERLSCNSGLMNSFITVSPDGQNRVKYERLAYLCGHGRGYESFRKLDKLTDQEYKLYERRARKLAQAHNINFDQEACFISSSALHGFYFPNLEKYNCIAFINGKPYLLNNDFVESLGNC